MAMSMLLLIGLCLIGAIVLGAGGVILLVYLSGQRDRSGTRHE